MGRFKFKATEDQVKQMAANAANNSRPVGMGMLHWKKEDHWETDDEIREDYQSWIGKYPNGRALAASVPGIEVINEAV